MKIRFLSLFLTIALIGVASAQAENPSDDSTLNAAGQTRPPTSVSMQDKIKFMKTRKQVLSNNPDLKAEQDSLAKQRQGIKDASPEDRKAFLQNWMAHQKKMKAAMLQVDPSLGPVFDQIEQQMKQKLEQRNGGN